MERIKSYLYGIAVFWLILILFSPFTAFSAMQSDSYIIYENINHVFDGPVISGVSCTSGTEQITVVWTTDVIANSFVEYSTDSGLAGSSEQGSSVKSSTSHSVDVTGLSGGTTYYYRAKSERVNGGETIDSTIRSCTPGSASTPPSPSPSGGGGGILIIDKTDKFPPEITNISVTDAEPYGFTVSWETDEDSTSFVEYGETANYGNTHGSWSTTTAHAVALDALKSQTLYHFRVLSSDLWGNLARSGDQTAATLTEAGEEILLEDLPAQTGEIPEEIGLEIDEEGLPESILTTASERLIELLNRFSSQISINSLQTTITTQYDALKRIADIIPAPIISAEPRIEIGSTEASFFWTTDKMANSLVAIAPDADYNPEEDEPYIQVVGDALNYINNHEVAVYGLEPDTLYHYQLRSAPEVGPTARSGDYTFRTRLEALEITSFYSQVLDNQSAVFKWVTNKDADSAVTFVPYRGNTLSVEESKTIRDNTETVIHEIMIKEFTESIIYDIELASQDAVGNLATKVLPLFSTSEDDNPPEITHIQTDSTVFVDSGSRIQTLISWRTNEPCTSKVYYQEGVVSGNKELMEETVLNTDYTKDHVVVITKFSPGVVYSFRAESIDSGNNTTISAVHTFMTPKRQESIFQIIIRILEETFSWVKKLT